jgi:hypothetical protein
MNGVPKSHVAIIVSVRVEKDNNLHSSGIQAKVAWILHSVHYLNEGTRSALHYGLTSVRHIQMQITA